MVKKGAKKKKTSKKKTTSKAKKPKVSKEKVQIELQPILVENFVSLQKVMVNLSVKMDNLNTKLASLLELFEDSAKAMAKKDFKIGGGEREEEIMNKLNNLSEQNKLIAKGLTLLHENNEEREPMAEFPPVPTPAPQRAVPNVQRAAPPKLPRLKVPGKEEGYKKSASQ